MNDYDYYYPMNQWDPRAPYYQTPYPQFSQPLSYQSFPTGGGSYPTSPSPTSPPYYWPQEVLNRPGAGHYHPAQHRPPLPPSMIAQFLAPDGSVNFAKTFQTVDQLMKSVNQITPIVKQISSFLPRPTPPAK